MDNDLTQFKAVRKSKVLVSAGPTGVSGSTGPIGATGPIGITGAVVIKPEVATHSWKDKCREWFLNESIKINDIVDKASAIYQQTTTSKVTLPKKPYMTKEVAIKFLQEQQKYNGTAGSGLSHENADNTVKQLLEELGQTEVAEEYGKVQKSYS